MHSINALLIKQIIGAKKYSVADHPSAAPEVTVDSISAKFYISAFFVVFGIAKYLCKSNEYHWRKYFKKLVFAKNSAEKRDSLSGLPLRKIFQ